MQQVPDKAKTDEGILEACFMGLAITPDNKTVYVAGGQTNKIFLFDLDTGKQTGTINCAQKANGTKYYHGYIGDMVLSKDGSYPLRRGSDRLPAAGDRYPSPTKSCIPFPRVATRSDCAFRRTKSGYTWPTWAYSSISRSRIWIWMI